MSLFPPNSSFFFFNDTATTEIYTLSLHDALPISKKPRALILDMTDVIHMDASGLHTLRQIHKECQSRGIRFMIAGIHAQPLDRKSTRLNSSHQIISYAVFCLKKKNQKSRIIKA